MDGPVERLQRWPRLQGTADFLRSFAREFAEDRVTGLSAEIAFWWILSIFPALLIVATVLASLDSITGQSVTSEVEEEVLQFVHDVFGDESQDPQEATEGIFGDPAAGLLTIGVILALWSTSRSFLAVIQALDIVYDLEERRGYVRLRLMGMGMGLLTILVAALTLSLVAVGPLLGAGADVADSLGLGSGFAWFWDQLRLPVAAAISVAWIATIYHWAPSRQTKWRWDLPGAVLAMAAWGLATVGFRIYLSLASGSSFIVGVLGGVLVLLLWLWLLAIGLLAGGELNALLVDRYEIAQVRRRAWIRPAIERLGGWVQGWSSRADEADRGDDADGADGAHQADRAG